MLRLVGRDLFVGQHAMLATEGPKIDRLTDQLNATAQHADEAPIVSGDGNDHFSSWMSAERT